MRTIKEGQLPSERLFVGTCFCCGWQGEAHQSELRLTTTGRTGEYLSNEAVLYYCICPTRGCGKTVRFTPKAGSEEGVKPKWEPAEKYIERGAEKYGGGQ